MNLSELKVKLTEQTEDVCQYLLPGGHRQGNYWKAGDVTGVEGKSLSVCLSGGRRGLWQDGNNTDHKGDLVDLWCLNKNIDRSAARKEIASFLGIRHEELRHAPKSNKKYDKPKDDFKVVLKGSDVYNYLVNDRKIDGKLVCSMVAQRQRGEAAMAFKYSTHDGVLALVKYINLQRDERGKKVVCCSSNSMPILFGMDSELVRKSKGILVICEGEIDALSWQSQGVPAVSVPFGAKSEDKQGLSPNDEWIANCFEWLEDFTTIYISMDMDEEGREAASAIAKRLGNDRCLIVELPFKDANECHVNEVDLKSLLGSAKMRDPDDIKLGSDLQDEVWSEFQKGSPANRGIPLMDWSDLKIRFREYESTGWTGFNGHGKTSLLRQFMAWIVCVHKEPVFVGSYEEPAKRYLSLLIQQAAGHFIGSNEYAAYKEIARQIMDLVIVHDVNGTAKYKDFFQNARYAARKYGIKHAVLDNVSMIDINLEDKEQCDKFMDAVQDFCRSTGVHLHIVLHPRKGADEKKPPMKMDIKGSGKFTDLLWNGITIHRDTEEDETNLYWWKQRSTGVLEMDGVELHFQEKSGRLTRKPMDYDKSYLERGEEGAVTERQEGQTVEQSSVSVDDDDIPF